MADSGLAAGGPPLPMAVSTDRLTVSPFARARRSPWPGPDVLAVFDAFVVLGLLGLYLKVALLAPQWGAVARFLGKQPGEPLGWLDPLGFFASDLVLNLLIVPFAATTIVGLAFGAWRALAACTISVVFAFVYFVELRASTEVGQYISGDMLHDFIGWSATHASSASDYLTTASIIKLCVVLATLGGVLMAARGARRSSSRRSRAALRLLLAAPAALAVAAVAVVTPIAYAVRLPNSPLNTSAVTRAAASLMTSSTTGDAGSPWLNLDAALAALRRLTHTAPFDSTHALVGQEAGADLIVMMMETGPAAAFEYTEDAAHRRGVERLRAHALVSSRHYTAHPYSSDALFAVLSGTYPHGRRLLLGDLAAPEVNGLFSGLPADVGLRGVYLPSLYQIELDDRMYGAFGARTLYVMFFPEIGHGPWPQLLPRDTNVLASGRVLMDLQDAWLDELLDVVAAARRLDRTVVALTADHGLRTRAEFPPLRVGFLSDVMFRVPLMIYAPRAVPAPAVLQVPTSHIDLAPTLLALLGAPDAAARMHGIPVWQRSEHDRLYLLASAYGGADGFLEGGRFYMHQTLSGAVYSNDRFEFGDADQAPSGDPIVPFVVQGLEKAREGQHALVARMKSGR